MSSSDHPRARDEPSPSTHKSQPLLWLLVLVALLALVWSFYNHRASEASPALTQPASTAPAVRPDARVVDRSSVRASRDTRPAHP